MRKKKKVKKALIFVSFFMLATFIISIYKIYGNINTYQRNSLSESGIITIKEAEDKNKTITQVLESVMPTVVGISKIKSNGITGLKTESIKELGLGSGVIVSEKGYILTNEHVSGGKYSTCYVTLENGKVLTATTVWTDDKQDLSIIKVNQGFTNYARLINSEDIKVGQNVYAIGNPIGMEFQRTVTSGIISATNRIITFEENGQNVYMDNLIQTDATINPGNSGGPLLNIYGEVIGINTIKISSAEGIGFAVPVKTVKPIIEKLEKTGTFEEATLGILAYDLNVIKYLEIENKIEKGIYVLESRISTEIMSKDNIIKIDEREIKNINTIREYIYTKQPGDIVKLTILRNNKEQEINIKLSKK